MQPAVLMECRSAASNAFGGGSDRMHAGPSLPSDDHICTAGLLVLLFWGYILFRNSNHPDFISLSIYGLAIVAFIFVTGPPLLLHVMNPLVNNSDRETPELIVKSKHVAMKPIIWLEKLGLLGGMLAPLFLILIVLGAAALIGYVNYTYFNS